MNEATTKKWGKQKSNMEEGIVFLVMEVDPEDRVTLTHNESLKSLLEQSKDIFEEPQQLPPSREFDHAISLIEEEAIVNIQPYRYSFL